MNRRDSDKERGQEIKSRISRILMHKAREHQQPLYMCFVDFKKAFDSISHDKFWVTLMEIRYPLHLIDLLSKPFKKQLAKVKVAGTLVLRKKSDKVVCFFHRLLVQYPSGDGDEGDPR